MDHNEKLGAHEVAAWLRHHPAFLQQFPDLAQTLQVPREEGRAASLASYQLDVLRDKNRELNRRLHDLFANAEENERLAVRSHQLTLALMRQSSRADTVRAMAASLAEDFHGDRVRVLLFDDVPDLDGQVWFLHAAEGSSMLAPFRDCIGDGEPLTGRLQADKQSVLYGNNADDVSSSLLLPVTGHGLVAVGSTDANRFYPGMGMLFAKMMAEAFATALDRYVAS